MRPTLIALVLCGWLGFLGFKSYQRFEHFLTHSRQEMLSEMKRDIKAQLDVHVESLNNQLQIIKSQLSDAVSKSVNETLSKQRSQP